MTFKYEFSSENKKYIVRFYPYGRERVVNYEPDIIRICHNNNIKVPNVILDSRYGPKCSLAYMVYEFVEGQTLSSILSEINPRSLYYICSEIVESLGKMAEIKINSFGELLSAGKGAESSWNNFVETSWHEGLNCSQSLNAFSNNELSKLNTVIKKQLFNSKPIKTGLVYSDLRPENIIITSNLCLSAIIDFEGVLSGDPLLALGYCYAACDDNSFFCTIKNCWVESIGAFDQTQIYYYSILRILRIAKYLNSPLPTGDKRAKLQEAFPGFHKSLDQIE